MINMLETIVIILLALAFLATVTWTGKTMFSYKQKEVANPVKPDTIPPKRKVNTLMDIQMNLNDLNQYNQETRDLVEGLKRKK